MSAPNIFKPESGAFQGVPILGLVDVSIQRSASKTKTRADGALAFTMAYAEGHARTVTVRLESNASENTLTPGLVGLLTFVVYLQADGTGAVSGDGKTVNFPAAASTGYAYLDSVSAGLPFEGKPTVSLVFDVIEASGNPSLLEEWV